MNNLIATEGSLPKGRTMIKSTSVLREARWEILKTKYPELQLFKISEYELNNYFRYKRILDIIFTIMVLPFFLMLSAIIILIIKIESRGPAIIKQSRIGYKGKSFNIYKFRSMVVAHNENKEDFYESNKITLFGRFIRKHRLDEIPQFWNLLKGEMSLIGPRPDIFTYFRQCVMSIPRYSERYKIKPGLTGWAQINYPHCTTTDCAQERLKYDLYYADNMNFRMDVKIIFRTVWVMFSGKGGK